MMNGPRISCTEVEAGNMVAHAVWEFIQMAKAVHLVPWVCDPTSESYDSLKVAEHCGWRRAILEVEQIIVQASNRLTPRIKKAAEAEGGER